MNLGEKLHALRRAKGLTQPDMAGLMGIEQSYLSKLENGKSLPSSDVLKRILDVFEVDVGDLVDDLDQGARNQLRQIPDVSEHFHRQKQMLIGNRRRWLLVSSGLLAVGAAFICAGYTHMSVPDFVYQYKSHGVVREGESREVFLMTALVADERTALQARLDEDFLSTRQYRGTVFNVPVEDGSRTYYLERENEVEHWQNDAVAFVGVLITVFGAMGIILEEKLSH